MVESEVQVPALRKRLLGTALTVAARAPAWVARIYYGLISPALSREQRAVLSGILSYHASERSLGANRFLLRRNTHRVEKGLMMRPRRSIFGLRYIGETVRAYEAYVSTLASSGRSDDAEWLWAHDVLGEYFRVTGSDPELDSLRARFRGLPRPKPQAGQSKPYQRDLSTPTPVGFDQLYDLAKRRRSVRWFLETPVPREMIDRALLVGLQAPSACNRQPFHFRIFDEPAAAKALLDIPAGTRGWSDGVPVAIAVVGELRAFFDARDRHLIYIDSSLAVMGFMYALEAQGLSSCPINFPDTAANERQARKQLSLKPDERVIMLIAVGYPDPDREVAYSHKRSLDELRSYNR